MAPARKKSASTGRSILDQDKYTAELSSGQLVIGITILLVFGLACFLLGVLVGKFEPVERQEVAKGQETTLASNTPTIRDATPAKPDRAKSADMPVSEPQAKPRAGASRERTVAISKKSNSGEGKVVTPRKLKDAAKPLLVGANASPKEEPSGAIPVVYPKTPVSPSTSVATPELKSAKAPPAPAKPKVETLAKATSPGEVKVETQTHAPDKPKKSDPPKKVVEVAAPKARVSGPYWAVQIASLAKKDSGPKVLQEVESKSPYKVQLVGSNDGRLVTVLAGRFDTREEAERARNDIRKKFPEFADCFLKRVP